jgi:hypothetical protein
MSGQEFSELVERAKGIEMTPEQKEEQRRSFAYGNANIENDAVTRDVVNHAAEELARTSRNKSGD